MFDNSEYFEAILSYGTLSKAAASLGISQPALSNYLKQLESKAGATLLDRSVSPIILTESGKIFYKYMKQSEAVKNNYLNEIGDLENNKSGTITIGGASSTTASYLSRVTARFLQKYPESNVKIVDGVVSDIARRAVNGEIDFFITPEGQKSSEFEYIKLLDERIFMCVPQSIVDKLSEIDERMARELAVKAVTKTDIESGKLTAKSYEPINASFFKNSRFILLEEGTNIRTFSNSLFEKWGFAPNNAIEVSQMLTGLQLCINGAGITFLPESILKFGSFKEYPAVFAIDENTAHRSMYACCKKDRYMSSLCGEYIEMLKTTLYGE